MWFLSHKLISIFPHMASDSFHTANEWTFGRTPVEMPSIHLALIQEFVAKWAFFPHISEVARKVPAPCMFVYSVFWLILLCFQPAQIPLPTSQHRAEDLTSSLRFSRHYDRHLLLLIREPYFSAFKSLHASVYLRSVLFMLITTSPASLLTAERETEEGSERLWSLWSKPVRLHSPARPGSAGAWSSWVETPVG